MLLQVHNPHYAVAEYLIIFPAMHSLHTSILSK